jgi:aspartyl-tRNA(Asn)/glutamyl-tRNA(Gln) amidotransferase subunit A
MRIGVVTDNHISADADPALRPAFEAAVSVLAEQGADVFETRLPLWAEVCTSNMVTMVSEAFAYHRQDLRGRWADYFSATRGLVALGALISGADYVQAQRVRRVAQQALGDLFSQADLIVCPTLQTGALSYESLMENGKPSIGKLIRLVNTGYWDSVGNPVLAVPIGFTDSEKPLSMQIAATPFGEADALRAGQVYQEHTRWHLRQPAICG